MKQKLHEHEQANADLKESLQGASAKAADLHLRLKDAEAKLKSDETLHDWELKLRRLRHVILISNIKVTIVCLTSFSYVIPLPKCICIIIIIVAPKI